MLKNNKDIKEIKMTSMTHNSTEYDRLTIQKASILRSHSLFS
jgi:hypothetical protein